MKTVISTPSLNADDVAANAARKKMQNLKDKFTAFSSNGVAPEIEELEKLVGGKLVHRFAFVFDDKGSTTKARGRKPGKNTKRSTPGEQAKAIREVMVEIGRGGTKFSSGDIIRALRRVNKKVVPNYVYSYLPANVGKGFFKNAGEGKDLSGRHSQLYQLDAKTAAAK